MAGQKLETETSNKVVEVINSSGAGRFVIVCEHASNNIPQEFNNLGLGVKARKSHIAWDLGALDLAKLISAKLDAPLVASCVSRLVYDCNRPPSVKSAVSERSEVQDIKGNIGLSKDQLDARSTQYYFPFRNTLSENLGAHTRRTGQSILVTIHTFTPVYHGRSRSMKIGVLHDSDSRMADGILNALSSSTKMKIARNQPYGPRDGVTHTLKEHGTKRGIPNVMLEVRNDLVSTVEQRKEIAQLLADAIQSAADNLNARMG